MPYRDPARRIENVREWRKRRKRAGIRDAPRKRPPACPAYLRAKTGGAKAWRDCWRAFEKANRTDLILAFKIEAAARVLCETRLRTTAALEREFGRQIAAIARAVDKGGPAQILPFLAGLPGESEDE